MNNSPNKINTELLDQAATWIARLRSDNLSQHDKHCFSEWLNQSQSHADAFDQMTRIWDYSGEAAQQSKDVYSEGENLEESWLTQLNAGVERLLSPVYRLINPLYGVLTLVFVVGLLTFTSILPKPDSADVKHYATTVGEQKEFKLEDGSIVYLNSQSKLETAFTSQRRSLTLSKGEAYFDVHSDKDRPFVVNFEQGSATAVGTAFNVYAKGKSSVVTVIEGKVNVQEHPNAAILHPTIAQLTADEEIELDAYGLGRVNKVPTENRIAWRDQLMIFDNTRLADALKELNRHLITPVEVNEQRLNDLRVSGTFNLHTPLATLEAIKATFNLEIARSSERLTLRSK